MSDLPHLGLVARWAAAEDPHSAAGMNEYHPSAIFSRVADEVMQAESVTG